MPTRSTTGSRPGPVTVLWRGLRRRCPRCGGGGLFTGWLTLRERCPTCGHAFEPPDDEGFFLGAMVVNFAVTEGLLGILLLASFVATLPDPPLFLLCAVSVPLMIVAPVAFYPYSKTIWAAIDSIMHPSERT